MNHFRCSSSDGGAGHPSRVAHPVGSEDTGSRNPSAPVTGAAAASAALGCWRSAADLKKKIMDYLPKRDF